MTPLWELYIPKDMGGALRKPVVYNQLELEEIWVFGSPQPYNNVRPRVFNDE